jgi:hypothetical protein
MLYTAMEFIFNEDVCDVPQRLSDWFNNREAKALFDAQPQGIQAALKKLIEGME